jgi:DinB superfamily
MSNPLIRSIIRTRFLLTSREKASGMIRANADAYLDLADRFNPASAIQPVTVPPMIGVDPEMQGWSFFQLLEHNAIVNRSIAAMVEALALGKEPEGAALINPRTDVLPKGLSGPDQIEAFRSSVDDYLSLVTTLPKLKGTAERPHPLFGPFDAHKWHCMFGLHLGLHLNQARKILSLLGK